MVCIFPLFYLLCSKSGSNPNDNFYTRKSPFIDVDMNYADYFHKPVDYSAGFDMRFKHGSQVSKIEREELERISVNFKKQKLLFLLENDNVSTFEKVKLIENFNILNESYDVNILSGGLLDDWEFNI